MSEPGMVVVGGGLAGAKAVEALRDKGYEGPLTLLAREARLPYERPPLSKKYLISGEGLDEATVHDRDWYAAKDVDLRLGVAATSLDLAARTVTTDSGDTLRYERLLLATGAQPRHLPVPGATAHGVLYLRTVEDSNRLRAVLRPDTEVTIVGGGWIGLEVAAAARQAGAHATVLEALDVPLRTALGPAMGQVFADLHRAHGVDLRTGVKVTEIEVEGPESEERAAEVRLADGSLVTADVVIVGIGAVPDTALAEAAGLDVDNGILTDAAGRTSDPNVYAAGDVACYQHPFLGERIRVEHWANALNQPATVAAAMLGEDTAYDNLPYFYTDQYDLGMEYVGWASPDDEVVVRGDLAAREFIAFWVRDGRVLAGMNVNVWDVVDDLKALIRSRAVVDRARLEDPDVPLSDLV